MKNKNNEKSLENSLNKAISDMDFSDISDKLKDSLDNFIDKTMSFLNAKTQKKPPLPIKNPNVCAQKLPEKSKATIMKILGFLSAFFAFTSAFAFIADFPYDFGMIGFALIFGILAGYLFSKTKKIDTISKDYERFTNELGHNTVIPIRDLASAIQKSETETINELLYMMNNSYFKQARIVENDSLFLLDIPTFRLYKEQKMNLPREKFQEEDKKIIKDEDGDNSKIKAENLVKISNKHLTSINLSIQRIENRAFLEKVIELKKTIQNIVNIIKRYPEKAYILDKFIDYYLPTTVKLIDAYTEYEIMSSDEKEIIKALKEIDSSISTINEAFEKIQLELLEDRTMDIKTDIDTMKLLLNQEGYLEKDWSKDE